MGFSMHDSEIMIEEGQSAFSVPLRCHRPMRTAVLTVPTPLSILGTMLMMVLALPRAAILAPALLAPVFAPVVAPVLARIKHHPRA